MLRLGSRLITRLGARNKSNQAVNACIIDSTVVDIFNPTHEHEQLRSSLRKFVQTEVDRQALEHNRNETFNTDLFKSLGKLGLLGVTAEIKYGGSGMDAVAAVIAHEELAASDPAFCLSFLAHSMLFVNNVNQNANHEQKEKYLPGACDGSKICGMGMSEPAVGTDVMVRDDTCSIRRLKS